MTKSLSAKEYIIVWAKAARAPFLIVSFLPAILGGIITVPYDIFQWMPFIVAIVGIVMAHSAADFFDDYYDFLSGNLGNKEKQFHDSPLISGEVTLGQVLFAAILCFIIALACGIYLFFIEPTAVVSMTILGAIAVFFYTAPPLKLNYRGLGELVLFFAFGPLIVLGVYWVVGGQFSWEPIIASIAPGVFTMNVGIVSNIFDHDDDVASKKYTMPVRFGQPLAVKILAAAIIIAYLSIILGVIFSILPVYALIVLITIPLTYQTIKSSANFHNLDLYTGAMTKAIATASLSSILLIIAYLLDIYL